MVYLDYNATTPVDPRVIEVMNQMHSVHFANPSSTHDAGSEAECMMDEAREDLAVTIGCSAMDVVFTSGATEANNMAVHSIARYTDFDCRILYGATEHKSVIEPCMNLARQEMVDARPVRVLPSGVLDLADLEASLAEYPPDLVSISMANSETGVVNPMKDIAEMVHGSKALLHSDITQALGKIPVSLEDLGIDIATCSSHKVYGPKGCGALVARRQVRRQMMPMITGGGQEGGLRSGTPNVPAIIGFGKACEIARLEMTKASEKVMLLRDNFEARMQSALPGLVTVNGGGAERLPNTSNMRIRGALADALITNLRGIAMSSGSACSSSTMEPSHVLVAMGLDRDAADECIRVSFGKQNTMRDVEKAVDEIVKTVKHLRKLEEQQLEGMR